MGMTPAGTPGAPLGGFPGAPAPFGKVEVAAVAAFFSLISLLFFLRSMKKMIPNAMAPRAARPPTTPPAMAPALLFFLPMLIGKPEPELLPGPEDEVAAAELVDGSPEAWNPPTVLRDAVVRWKGAAVEAAEAAFAYRGDQARPSFSPAEVVQNEANDAEYVEAQE
jgi:hypothetical protein